MSYTSAATLLSRGSSRPSDRKQRPSSRKAANRVGAEEASRGREKLASTSRRLRRREVATCGLALLSFRVLGAGRSQAEVEEEFAAYRDPHGRFGISVPFSWRQSDKPGAEVLFRNAQKTSSNLGITVNPVKVQSLQKFGSVDDIGQRLFEIERQKDGFKSLTLLEQRSQLAKTDAAYAVYVYELDTTRGKKRIVAGVTIDNFRLFIVNGQCRSDSLSDFDLLKRAVASFVLL